jgi:peroxiredoxin family protein
MGVMEIAREDLIDEVEELVGVATFIKRAAGASIQFFI